MELGPDRLKETLAVFGLKTGGTVQQRPERLFLTKGVALKDLHWKHFPKGYQTLNSKKSEKEIAQQVSASKVVALSKVKMLLKKQSDMSRRSKLLGMKTWKLSGRRSSKIRYVGITVTGVGKPLSECKAWRHQYGMRCLGTPNT